MSVEMQQNHDVVAAEEEDSTISVVWTCPSFSSYSIEGIAEVAAKVVESEASTSNQHSNGEDDEEFEFPSDFIFSESGQIQSLVFPVFNCDLISGDLDPKCGNDRESDDIERARESLMNLFVDEQDQDGQSSSSEADESEMVRPESKCLWATKSPSPGRCKKSNSTGSCSKRWSFRQLLRRSSSDGKTETFVIVNPIEEEKSIEKNKGKMRDIVVSKGKGKASAHEVLYVRNKAAKQADKRRSYLPYKQDLVGLFGYKTFPPF